MFKRVHDEISNGLEIRTYVIILCYSLIIDVSDVIISVGSGSMEINFRSATLEVFK